MTFRTPQPAHRSGSIAIVGAGFSGALLAINLLRSTDMVVHLIEREPDRLARGLAFGTNHADHILNVRAANMSAFPDDLGHFCGWLGAAGKSEANRFVPRRTFGAYLAEQLEQARASAPHRLKLVQGRAVAAEHGGGGWTIEMADGSRLACDRLALAQGNSPPAPLPHFEALGADIYAANPWSPLCVDGLERTESILLIGMGLTAIDAALTLDSAGFKGRIIALSRRGIRPRPHAPVGPYVERVDKPDVVGSALIRRVRARAQTIGWRAAIDEIRPATQDLWRRMTIEERQRFLRHLRPFWDAHRHRLAPAVDHRVWTMQMQGRLSFAAGKVVGATREGSHARVEWRVRGTDILRSETVARVINCTGPTGLVERSNDPLLRHLLARGSVRQDALGLGIEVDRNGHVLDGQGRPQRDLLAVGPMTRAESWEIVAVPDIRHQVWNLARRLGNAHLVEGDGL